MTIIQKIMKAGDLPPEWAKEFPDPNMSVELSIREYDEELAMAKTSIEVFDIVARRAKERGLTPETLEEILTEK